MYTKNRSCLLTHTHTYTHTHTHLLTYQQTAERQETPSFTTESKESPDAYQG